MRAEPADVLVAGCAAALALGDVQLHRHHRRLVTDTLRRPAAAVVLVVLTLHVLNVLGPLDPFRFIARRIPQEGPCP